MTLVPLNECCLRLGIDPKTLRLWLKVAQLSCCLHPTDARLKCLTLTQLQQLAELHGRPLPSSLPNAASQAVAGLASAPATDLGDTDDLHQQLGLLRQQVSTLQAEAHGTGPGPATPELRPPATHLCHARACSHAYHGFGFSSCQSIDSTGCRA